MTEERPMPGVNEAWEDLRGRHRPAPPIKLLLIGESIPARSTFFYVGGKSTGHTKKAFQRVAPELGNLSDERFLRCFCDCGCYLDDLSLEPVKGKTDSERNYMLLKHLDGLKERLRRYKPKAVVAFVKRTDFFVRFAVEEAFPESRLYVLPFPGSKRAYIDAYVNGLAEVIAKEIELGNLSRECLQECCRFE